MADEDHFLDVTWINDQTLKEYIMTINEKTNFYTSTCNILHVILREHLTLTGDNRQSQQTPIQYLSRCGFMSSSTHVCKPLCECESAVLLWIFLCSEYKT